MAKKPTIGDILKEAKAESNRIRKKAIAKARKVTGVLPIKGPIKYVPPLGVNIAELASLVSQNIVNQAADIAFQDLQNIPLPIKKRVPPSSEIQLPETEVAPRVRTDKQLINDQIMRTAMSNANTRARKKNGQLKKGMTQRRIALMAQKECTKERQRLGLCEKPMKRRK